MSKHNFSRSWKELIRQEEKDLPRIWTRKPSAEAAAIEFDEEEIEQNQYLWAEYIGDLGAG